MDKFEKLNELFTKSKDFFASETLEISKHASNFVNHLGVGNVNADIVFVGEAPGANEDKEGVPFVGVAGSILREGLLTAGISTNDVWFTNVVKWRPIDENYKNRKPTVHEINVSYPLLEKELLIINPKVIVTLGVSALDALTDYRFSSYSIYSLIGNISYEWKSYPLFIMFHPMVVEYDKSKARIFYENLSTLKSFVEGLRKGEDEKSELEKLLKL